MKLAITGATGQLGQIVVNVLKSKTDAGNIIALVRNPAKAAGFGVEARVFDYDSPETLVQSLQGVDKVLLISGNEVGKRTQQHQHVIEAAKKAGVKTIVYTSLLKADTSSLSLAPEHLETENILKASGLDYTILRNGWYTENYTASIAGVLAAGAVYGSAGEGKTASASREDYAKAAVAVLLSDNHKNNTYELAGDEAYTLAEYAAEISKQTGNNIPYHNVSNSEYANILEQAGLPAGVAQFVAGFHIGTEKGDLFDNGHQLSSLIGTPTTPAATTIAEALAQVK